MKRTCTSKKYNKSDLCKVLDTDYVINPNVTLENYSTNKFSLRILKLRMFIYVISEYNLVETLSKHSPGNIKFLTKINHFRPFD